METIIDKVDKALREEFPGAATELELDDGKVWGFVIWKKFVGIDTPDRFCQLREALIRHFGKNYRRRISSIFPLSTYEMNVRREELANPM